MYRIVPYQFVSKIDDFPTSVLAHELDRKPKVDAIYLLLKYVLCGIGPLDIGVMDAGDNLTTRRRAMQAPHHVERWNVP